MCRIGDITIIYVSQIAINGGVKHGFWWEST